MSLCPSRIKRRLRFSYRGEQLEMKKRQLVTIKGTKNGLGLHLYDNCSYEDLLKELQYKLNESSSLHNENRDIKVKVELGNRYVTDEQKETIIHLIQEKQNLTVQAINSNLVTKKEAENWLKQNELKSITSIVRSGQVLEVPGDLLLIGDVNPGGKVIAGGNIYIMGQLKGIAHAGYNGKDDAVIAASVMKPTQIRISRFIERELGNTSSEKTREMECAYVNDSVIKIDRLQVLPHLRPNLLKLEGGY